MVCASPSAGTAEKAEVAELPPGPFPGPAGLALRYPGSFGAERGGSADKHGFPEPGNKGI